MASFIRKLLKEEQWFPEQIVGHCFQKGVPMVCVESIYRYIRLDKQLGGSPYLTEFADHLSICKKLNTVVYFTDPYSSWQKGAIENANKLIRQYIPKKTSFAKLNDLQIKEIQYKLNKRPRKKLGFLTPVSLFFPTFT